MDQREILPKRYDMYTSTVYISLSVHFMYYIVFRMNMTSTQTLLMYPTYIGYIPTSGLELLLEE